MDRLIKLPSFDGIAAGATAYVNAPLGLRYKNLNLSVTNTAGDPFNTLVSDVTLEIDNVVQRTYSTDDDITTMPELYMAGYDSYVGWFGEVYTKFTSMAEVAKESTPFTIWFKEPWMLGGPASQELFSWSMGGVVSFQIKVRLKPGISTAGLKVSATALVDNTVVPLGAIRKRYRTQVAVNSIGNLDFVRLPKNNAYLSILPQTDALADISLKLDGAVIIEGTRDEVVASSAVQNIANFSASGSGYFPYLVFNADRNPASALPMKKADGEPVQNFALRLGMTAASSFDMVYETVGFKD